MTLDKKLVPDMSRRDFLQLVAGSGAAQVLAGDKFFDKLISEVGSPKTMKQGLWTEFATTCRECPAGCGMHVRCQDYRAIKAEGNPQHPVNRGGLCPRGQSSLQGQYDPDRLDRFLRADEPREKCKCTWRDFTTNIAEEAGKAKRIVIVSDVQRGAMAEVMEEFARSCGKPAEVIYYEAFNYEAARGANVTLFGIDRIPRYRFDKCEMIVSFGADFLESWTSSVEYAGQFAQMHHQGSGIGGQMVYIGPKMSMTAASADEFLPNQPKEKQPESTVWIYGALRRVMKNRVIVGGDEDDGGLD